MAYKSQAYQSFFSYSLARPYPFRWFTPVAICLLTSSTIIFSFVNVASSGYSLVVQPTNDPNATLSANTWLERWPSFITSKVRSTCPPYTIPVKTQLFTNNTALTYTLTDVWREDAEGTRNISSSLSYQNNVLQDCIVTIIDMDFDSQDRSAVQLSYSQWGAKVSVYSTCRIHNHPDGPTRFNITILYNYVPNTVRYGQQEGFLGSVFLSRNHTTQASLWWGESLLSMSWATTCRELQDIRASNIEDGLGIADKGTVNFRPRRETPADITDLTFFDLDYQFIKLNWTGIPDFFLPPQGRTYDIGTLDAEEEFPNIWRKADVLAKAAYSAVLTDLGQVDAPYNLLSDSEQLAHFTANFSDWNNNIANARPGPEVESYSA